MSDPNAEFLQQYKQVALHLVLLLQKIRTEGADENSK